MIVKKNPFAAIFIFIYNMCACCATISCSFFSEIFLQRFLVMIS